MLKIKGKIATQNLAMPWSSYQKTATAEDIFYCFRLILGAHKSCGMERSCRTSGR